MNFLQILFGIALMEFSIGTNATSKWGQRFAIAGAIVGFGVMAGGFNLP
jgi:hypothetical protein